MLNKLQKYKKKIIVLNRSNPLLFFPILYTLIQAINILKRPVIFLINIILNYLLNFILKNNVNITITTYQKT